MTKSIIGLAAVGAVALAGCGSSGKSDSTTTSATTTTTASTAATSTPAATAASGGPIAVALSEWAVKPSATTAKAGKVTFKITNDGKIPHELVVLKTTKQADQLGTGNRIKEVVHVGEQGDLAPGTSKTLTLKLKKGHYSLVCNLPGHYMSGMHSDFTVD